MADTLKRIVGPVNVPNGTGTAFTAVASHTYTLKSIRLVNNTTASITVQMGINGTTNSFLVLAPVSLPTVTQLIHDCFLVMSGTETLQTSGSLSGVTLTVCGLDQG